MKIETLFVVCITLITVLLPLYDAAIPANEIEMTRVLDNNTSNICFDDADCNGHGRCINIGKCVCDPGWTTYSNVAEKNNSCWYEQHPKIIAFLVSFFVGTLGVDWFYLSSGNREYIVAGIFKLLLICGCCFGESLCVAGYAKPSKVMKSVGIIIIALSVFGSIVWWIVDWARILGNKFPDGNGVELKPF